MLAQPATPAAALLSMLKEAIANTSGYAVVRVVASAAGLIAGETEFTARRDIRDASDQAFLARALDLYYQDGDNLACHYEAGKLTVIRFTRRPTPRA